MSSPLTWPCCGCGDDTGPSSAMVAVVLNAAGAGEALNICLECWRHPGRRPGLKAHFFSRADADQAVDRAGASSIG